MASPSESKTEYKSKEWVHCHYCPKCSYGQKCLLDEHKRKKCPSAMRKDNLTRHTDALHKGNLKRACGEKKQSQLSISTFSKRPCLSQESNSNQSVSSQSSVSVASTSGVEEQPDPSLVDIVFTEETLNVDAETITTPSTQTTEAAETTSQVMQKDTKVTSEPEMTVNMVKKQVDTLFDTVKSSSDRVDAKLDEILIHLRDRTAQMKEKEKPSCSQSSADKTPATSPFLNQDNTMRSIDDILSVYTDFKALYNHNKIVCTVCEESRKERAKNGSQDKSPSTGDLGVFTYDYERIGYAFNETQPLPREFRNVKSHISRHCMGENHLKSLEYAEQKQREARKLRAKNAQAGMACGRLAYKVIYRGRPYSDYPVDVLVEQKNGGTVGDLNHSKIFPRLLLGSVYEEVKQRVTNYMHSPLQCTGKPPPCGILADKATMKKRTGQITGMVSVFPDAGHEQMMQSLYLSNTIVKEHSGKETAKSLEKVVQEFLDKEKLSEQLVAGGFDGQYFHNSVDKYLSHSLNLDNAHFTHDFAHRMQLAEKDARDAGTKVGDKTQYYHGFVNKAIKLISEVLSDIRFGKKFERVLEAMEQCPDEKFYKLDTFSTTRFATYSSRVFKAFVLDLKPIVMALEGRAANKDTNKEDASIAQSLLNSILSLKAMSDLAGIADIYEELGKLSRALQKVNSFLWEKLDHVKKTTDHIKAMAQTLSEMKKPEQEPPQDKWPLLHSIWQKLLKNEFMPGTPIHPQPTVRYVTRNARFNSENALPGLVDSKRDLQDFLQTLENKLKERLFTGEEQLLAENVRTLTSFSGLVDIASSYGEELFVTRALQERSFWDASKAVVKLGVDEATYMNQVKKFLHRLYPIIKEGIKPDKEIICRFCKDADLFDTIPDFLHCLLCACIKGAVESVVEAMGSKLEYHNQRGRNLTPESVNEAVFVAWNGPPIHHCDNVVRSALNRHFGGKDWHFVTSHSFKPHKVSKAVDSIQRQPAKFPMML